MSNLRTESAKLDMPGFTPPRAVTVWRSWATPIAYRYDDDPDKVYIVDRKFSLSTTKHQNKIASEHRYVVREPEAQFVSTLKLFGFGGWSLGRLEAA